jgi:hypothetical protein
VLFVFRFVPLVYLSRLVVQGALHGRYQPPRPRFTRPPSGWRSSLDDDIVFVVITGNCSPALRVGKTVHTTWSFRGRWQDVVTTVRQQFARTEKTDSGLSFKDPRSRVRVMSRGRMSVMSIELTREQQDALDKQGQTPQRLIDPRTHTAYVLVPENEYETMREIVEDERREHAIHAVALRNAADRLNEMP